jgi:hypothetical protein
MIALQSRNPQVADPTRITAQYANMMNMARQQEAAQLQGERARQEMEFARAGEAREAELQPFKVTEAQSKANSERLKYVMDFYDTSAIALSKSYSPQQAAALGDRMKQMFPEPELQASIDETVAELNSDPANFEVNREKLLRRTMDAKDQTARDYIKQTTGTEERLISVPKFGGGGATEVPGSRSAVAQGMQYVKTDTGDIVAVPKTTGGSFATPTPSAGAPGKGGVAVALQTNPGALKDGSFAKSQKGYTGASGGFATFKTPEDGIAAQENLLRGSYVNKGFNTVNKIIDRYAPQGPENSAASVSNYKKYVAQKAGVDINAPITAAQVPAVAKAMREFETGNTSGGAPAGGPVTVVKGSGAKDAKSTEAERRFGTVAKNMIDSIKEATSALSNSPGSAAPGTGEYIASQIPFYGDEARKFAQSGPRQRFEAALMALLDGVTYVSTGSGVTAMQEISYKNTYIPSYQDTPLSRKAKLQRAVRFISNLKDAAGNRWTPDMDVALDKLKATVAKIDFGGGKPAAKSKTPVQRKASGGFTVTRIED